MFSQWAVPGLRRVLRECSPGRSPFVSALAQAAIAGREDENPELEQRVKDGVLGISGEMLREGIEIIPDSAVDGGARVRVVGENLEIDLTTEAISSLLLKHLLPRYRAILDGSE